MSTDEYGKGSLKRAKIESVCNFLLRYPTAKDFEVIQEMKCSRRTVAYARAELVERGLLPQPRKKEIKPTPIPRLSSPESTLPSVAPNQDGGPKGTDSYSGQLVTPATVAMLAADDVDDTETDVETQRKMTREARRMAFDLTHHPDTRMSAMQLWVKLKDAAKARDLGPGVPMNRATAKDRGKDLFRAMGIQLVVEIIEELWGNKKETTDAPTTVEAPIASGTPEATSTAGHESDPAEAQDLRPVNLDGGEQPNEGDHDLPRPSA